MKGYDARRKRNHRLWTLLWLMVLFGPSASAQDDGRSAQAGSSDSTVVNSFATSFATSLTGTPGDAQRGRLIAIDPAKGNCLICHRVPDAGNEPFQGNIGPSLTGVGDRLAQAQLRLRLIDSTRINPDSVMPAYHRVDKLHRVARQWRGRPVLSASEIEDVVAWLMSLKGMQQ